jgi:hypothetical protein
MKRCFPYLIGLFLVQSCCAYHTVTLKNDSGDDKRVTLRGHRYNDVLPKGLQLQSVTIDSAACTYSFILPRNSKLVVQRGIGFPDFEQQVIVDHNDTIRLRNDPRAKLKFRRIDYYIAVTVNL